MQLEVISRGEAREFPHPVLFIHGAWHGAWCWDEYFLPYFAERGFEVHALSLRGHGNSEGETIRPIARVADYVDDVRMVLAQFERSPVLVGHSLGGLVMQHLWHTYRDFPAAAMLAPGPHFGIGGIVWRTLTRRPWTAFRIVMGQGVHPLITEPEPDGRTFFSPDMPESEQRRHMRRFTPESFPAVGIDALFWDLPRPVVPPFPLLVMGGKYDTLFPPDEIQRTAQAYDTWAVIVSDVGHEMMLDPGWERVADYIIYWLCEQGAD